MAKRLNLFPTPVIVDELEEAESLNIELERAIYDRMNADPGIKRSNVGGWHSKTDLLDWNVPAVGRITDHALELATANTKAPSGVEPRWAMKAWANVNPSGAGNAPHIHGANFWAAVYYVKTGSGEGGRLWLHDPRMPGLRMYAPSLRFTKAGPEGVYKFTPKPGQMVLFPAWLSHSVEPATSNDSRISIAMNIRRIKARTKAATAGSAIEAQDSAQNN